MRGKTSWRRVAVLTAIFLVVALLGGAFLYIQARRDVLTERFRQYLTQKLSNTFNLDVKIGSVAGDPRGTIALRDVHVSVRRDEGPAIDVFTCGEVRFRYTLLDFFRENFTSWFDVVLYKPTFYADVPFSVQKPEARGHSFELFSGFVQKVRSSARLIIEDGTVAWIGMEGTLSGIEGVIANRSFDLSLTLNHLTIGNFDTTTLLRIDGQLIGDSAKSPARLTGSAVTQGTVINWKPVPSEARVHFDLTEDHLKLWDSYILGGISIAGTVGHTSRRDVDLVLSVKNYPLKEMHDIMSFSSSAAVGGKMTGKLIVQGDVMEPRLVGEFAIEDNTAPGARFRALQLFFEGIFPQVKISRSQMILSNGNPMQFASDQEIHVKELFSSVTYERLIARSEQRTVTWKNWTLYREGDRDSVLLEHPLSKNAVPAESEDTDAEAEGAPGLDTLLGGRESIKMELKDDEQMFTLQKKAQF